MSQIYDEAVGSRAKALAAIETAERKNSKFAAWSWAETAMQHALDMGISNARDLVAGSGYPDLAALRAAAQSSSAEIVIVSRHQGVIEWLARRGIVASEIISHITSPVQVRGKVVYGNVPLYLAAVALKVVTIDMPNLPAEKRGVDLSPEEMETYGAHLQTYQVRLLEE